jgi:hypothetical protein
VSQNENGGALHLYRSDSSIRPPDARKLVAEGLLENITAPQTLEMRNYLRRIENISPFRERKRQPFYGALALGSKGVKYR